MARKFSTTDKLVFADIDEKDRLKLTFPYDYSLVQTLKGIGGGRFQAPDKGGPAWLFAKEMTTLKRMRRDLGDNLLLSPELKAWILEEKERKAAIKALRNTDGAKLENLGDRNEALWEAIHLGPRGKDMELSDRAVKLAEPIGSYQSGDVAFMAAAMRAGYNPLVALQPGLGKTIESIAAVHEVCLDEGPNLVIAPITSLETVWVRELSMWQPHPVFVALGSKDDRLWVMEDAQAMLDAGEPFWLVINPQMTMWKEEKIVKDGQPWHEDRPQYPFLFDVNWNTIVLDEAHKSGVSNTDTKTFKALMKLKAQKRIALTGTPVGGSPIKLLGILKWLNPHDPEFKAKWIWAGKWLEVVDNGFGKSIGRVKRCMMHFGGPPSGGKDCPECQALEAEFADYISQWVVRRTKLEVLKDLPPKQHVELWAQMEGRQAAQYKAMAEEAEARISEEESITATGILAEYTRLKQFATSECELGKIINAEKNTREVIPTTNSCKLPVLLELLEERGIVPKVNDEGVLTDEGDEQVVIFSQFSKVVDMVTAYLQDKGVRAVKITGATNQKGYRTQIQDDFQSDEQGTSRVLVMTTTAGGVAITLDRASTVIFMDETWIPDDQEQAEDRCHRASRIHQVTVYYIRTKGTIEEYIMNRVDEKDNINKSILDLYRSGVRLGTGEDE